MFNRVDIQPVHYMYTCIHVLIQPILMHTDVTKQFVYIDGCLKDLHIKLDLYI